MEHEAFIGLLAERRGATVQPVVAAGADAIGDALLVVRRLGRPLSEVAATLEAGAIVAMWESLAALHGAGISHGSIDCDRLFIDGDAVRIADLMTSEVGASPNSLLADKAQLLVTTTAVFGTERAVEAAVATLGAEGLAEVSSYVQPAALSASLRKQVQAAALDVDEVRRPGLLRHGLRAGDGDAHAGDDLLEALDEPVTAAVGAAGTGSIHRHPDIHQLDGLAGSGEDVLLRPRVPQLVCHVGEERLVVCLLYTSPSPRD